MINTNVYKVYYQLAANKFQIEILDANIERLDITVRMIPARYIKTVSLKNLMLTKSPCNWPMCRRKKTRVINLVNNGYLGLKLLMGMPIRDSLVLTETISYERIVQDLPAVGDFKYSDRKEFQYTELGIKLNQYNIQTLQAEQVADIEPEMLIIMKMLSARSLIF